MTTPTLPHQMKAWQYTSTKGGLAANLFINAGTPVPTPSPSQHLVKVRAVALNPVDYKPAEVQLLHRLVFPKPATPGIDFVGEVVRAAAGTSFKPGQLIFGVGGKSPFAGGMLAEYALVEHNTAIELPEGMSAIDAAATGVAALTAYQSIVPRARPGSRILINGGSGGCGIFGIQIARALGHEVTATCSSRNVELCRSLGAEVIDYTKGSVVEAVKKSAATRRYDLVIDNVFSTPDLYWKAHEYTSPGSIYVCVAGTPSLAYFSTMLKMKHLPAFLGGGKRRIEGFLAEPKMEQLTKVRTWMTEGKVKAVVDERFRFEMAKEAFLKLKTGRAVGKIVVEVGTTGTH